MKMKFKSKIGLSILILVFMVSFNSVSAADINVTGTNFTDVQSAINSASNGDTIYLSNSTYIGTGTQITINKNLTISGAKSSSSNEKSTLNANNLSRIFSIAPNVKVTLIDLIMTNGYSPNSGYGGGGAILNQGDLTITNSDLFNNKVVTKGGAIYNSLGNLTIINSTLSNNAAPLDGGAIFNNQGKITITGSNFKNNIVSGTDHYGGAIANDQNGIVTISDSVFTNNSANNGGAISNSWTMTITNSTFNNNKASGVSGSLTSGNGAAISNSATLTITQSQFLDNTAINTGGAISNGIKTSGFSIVTRGNLNVTNSLFKNNTATDGGSIYNRYATANLLRNSFENGIAKNGAFIYNYNNLNFIIVSSSVLNLTENTMVNGAATTTGNYIYNLGNAGVLNLTYLNNQTVPVTTGQLVQLVATLTDDMGNNVTGQTITFYVDGVKVGSTTVIEGVALLNYTVPTSWLLGSYHPVTGNYTGSTGFTIVLKNGQLKLGKLDTMTTVDPVSGKPGQTVTINVHVTDENGNPVNGSVTVTAPDGQLVSVTVTNGVGTSTWNVSDTLTPGTYTNLTADYAGNGTYNPSTGNNTAAIGKLNTTTTIDPVSGKPGQTVTINVHVTDENGNPVNETTNITTPDGQVIAITITNGEGTGSWTISTSLTPRIYSNLTASFTETVLYNPSQNTTTATITNIPTNSGGNSTSVPSEGADVNAATVTKTIGMQKTGAPFTGLILSLLLVLGGLITSRKNQK